MEDEAHFNHYYGEDSSGRKDYLFGYWIKLMHTGRRGRRSAIPYFIYRSLRRNIILVSLPVLFTCVEAGPTSHTFVLFSLDLVSDFAYTRRAFLEVKHDTLK